MSLAAPRDYIPISRQFPGKKGLGMDDEAAAKRKASDLRINALKSQANKRQCSTTQPFQQQQTNQQQQQQQQQHHHGIGGGAQQPTGAAQNSNAAEAANNSIKPVIDFSGFNSQIRQQRATEQPSSANGLLTFDDLASGAPALRADTSMDDFFIGQTKLPPTGRSRDANNNNRSRDAFGSLPPQSSRDGFASTSLPPAPQHTAAAGGAAAAAGSLAAGAAGTAGAAAAAAPQYDLVGLASLPWDWSLKTRVKLASARPFSCLEGLSGLGAACHVASTAACAAEPQDLGLEERLEQSLLQWQHPAQQLPPQALAAMQEAKPMQELLQGRCAQWRAAFKSLFDCMRHGRCQVAYVVGTQGRQGGLPKFAATFCAPGTHVCPEAHAVLTRSTRALRQSLDHAGITYTVQAPAGGSSAAQTSGAPAGVQDGSAASQLLLIGSRNVLGLFQALLQQPWCTAGHPDVPLLLAPVSFCGATLSALSIKVLPHIGTSQPLPRTASTSARLPSSTHNAPDPPGAITSERLHYAECCGQLVTPWALQRLLRTLTEAHGGDFEAYLDTEPSSAGLNVGSQGVTQGVDGGVGVAGGSGGLTAVEMEELQQGLRLSQVLRQLRCSDGSFSAKLAN